MVNKHESKYYDTAIRMVKAFLEILETKDFEYITVKEICTKANVNRSTFYLHYETMNDLLNESAEYIADTMGDYFTNQTITGDIAAMDPEELYFINKRYLIPWLTSIKENRRLFEAALKKGNILGIDKYTKALKKEVLEPVIQRHGIEQEKAEYMIAYYVDGILAMVNVWLKHGCQKEVEEMAELIMLCVNRGMGNEEK